GRRHRNRGYLARGGVPFQIEEAPGLRIRERGRARRRSRCLHRGQREAASDEHEDQGDAYSGGERGARLAAHEGAQVRHGSRKRTESAQAVHVQGIGRRRRRLDRGRPWNPTSGARDVVPMSLEMAIPLAYHPLRPQSPTTNRPVGGGGNVEPNPDGDRRPAVTARADETLLHLRLAPRSQSYGATVSPSTYESRMTHWARTAPFVPVPNDP